MVGLCNFLRNNVVPFCSHWDTPFLTQIPMNYIDQLVVSTFVYRENLYYCYNYNNQNNGCKCCFLFDTDSTIQWRFRQSRDCRISGFADWRLVSFKTHYIQFLSTLFILAVRHLFLWHTRLKKRLRTWMLLSWIVKFNDYFVKSNGATLHLINHKTKSNEPFQ